MRSVRGILIYSAGQGLRGVFLAPAWSCEIEISHMGKKPISYRQRWEKMYLRICVPNKDLYQPAHPAEETLDHWLSKELLAKTLSDLADPQGEILLHAHILISCFTS